MMFLKRFVTNLSGKVPLRTVLVIPFVLQIVAAVGLTGYLSFRNGHQAVNDLVSQLQDEVSDRIYERLTHYLEPPRIVNQINADAIRRGFLDINQIQQIDRYLWNQIRQFDDLTFIAIATESGNYIGIGRQSGGDLLVGVLDRRIDGTTRTWSLDFLGNRISQRESLPNYDPRTRSWYTAAKGARQLVWSDIYVAYDQTQALLLPANQPVYDPRGNLIGVVTSNVKPSTISRFLSSLNVGENGATFIVEQNGLLVATSTNDPPTHRPNRGSEERLLAIHSPNPLVRSTARYLEHRFGALNRIQEKLRLTPQLSGDRYFIQVRPFQDERGLDWLVVVVIPESDFMGQIQANTQTTALLCLGALLGAIALGYATSRWITKPILQLSQAAEALSQGNWQQPVTVKRTDELGTLAESFIHMRDQLKHSRHQLEDYSRGLEQLVNERTQAMQQSEEKFSKAFRSSPEPMAIAMMADGRIIEANDSYLTCTGYSQEEVLGKTATELNLWVRPEDKNQVTHLIEAQGFVHNLEIGYRKKSGELGTILLSAEVIELNGRPCLLYVNSDISDRKRAETALRQAKEAAEAANRAKSEFLANMSHELRTPLNAILGFTQVMAGDPQTTPQQKNNLGIISRSGEHLLALINDVLDMSKIEAGRITLNPTAFDLYHLLDSLTEMLDLRATSKGLHLCLDCAPDLPRYVVTDANKLRQVLLNLVGNAVKFTQQGGVTLRVRTADKGEKMEADGDKPPLTPTVLLQFEIEDTGSGIASDELATLFQPFSQAEAGRRSNQGSGLGLTISRKFVQLMWGDITVDSVLGKGSCFRFTIQVYELGSIPIPHPQPSHQAIALAPGQPTYRLLVVDDVKDNRLLISQLLVRLGFEVQEATNGEEAIALWQSWHPHLIWMDMRMPVLNGYDATRQIRHQERTSLNTSTSPHPATIIIALTASAFEEERDIVLGAGCDDLVRKPFRESTIWGKITEHLGVQFLYEPTSPEWIKTQVTPPSCLSLSLSATPPHSLTPASFTIMPSSWIAALHQAATSGDDGQVTTLVNQIPERHVELAIALTALIDNFRLDVISDLTRPC